MASPSSPPPSPPSPGVPGWVAPLVTEQRERILRYSDIGTAASLMEVNAEFNKSASKRVASLATGNKNLIALLHAGMFRELLDAIKLTPTSDHAVIRRLQGNFRNAAKTKRIQFLEYLVEHGKLGSLPEWALKSIVAHLLLRAIRMNAGEEAISAIAAHGPNSYDYPNYLRDIAQEISVRGYPAELFGEALRHIGDEYVLPGDYLDGRMNELWDFLNAPLKRVFLDYVWAVVRAPEKHKIHEHNRAIEILRQFDPSFAVLLERASALQKN